MWYMFAHLSTESIKLTDEQKQTLLESIDYSRLSEAALLRAYETELVPQAYITRAALELCGKLRQELQEAKHIIITQERELEKLNALRFSSHYSKPRAESKGINRLKPMMVFNTKTCSTHGKRTLAHCSFR